MKWYVYFIASLLVLLHYSCKDPLCEEYESYLTYVFEIPVSIAPAKDTLRIGDTLSVHIEFDAMTYDRLTDQRYDLSNLPFDATFFIKEISEEFDRDGLDFFELLVPNNLDINRFLFQSSDGSVLEFDYLQEDGKFSISFQLIAEQKGLFTTSFGESLEYSCQPDFPGKCRTREYSFWLETNDGGENNLNFLSNSPHNAFSKRILGNPEKRFHKFGGYAFYVVE